jgi:carbamoyltransferase
LHHVPPPAQPFEQADMPASELQTVDSSGRFPVLRKVVNSLGAKQLVQRLTQYQPVPDYDSPDTEGWRLLRAILRQWIGALDRPVILMPLPLPQHIDETCDASGYQARFAELAAELGCTLHDPLADFLTCPKAQRRRLRWDKDVHFTPEGHNLVAASLAPVLERVLAGAPVRREVA